MAKPGSRTVAVPWPDPYVFTVYMTHRLSVYILYWHTNAALILVTSYLHIHFSYVHECILTALYCAVFVLLMHVFLWLSLLLLLYIVNNDENKDDQSIIWTNVELLSTETNIDFFKQNTQIFVEKVFENICEYRSDAYHMGVAASQITRNPTVYSTFCLS